MKAAIVFLLFVTLIFSQTVHLRIGGTSCIPDEAETCTPNTGSTRVDLEGGVAVNDDNECAAGAGTTPAVVVPWTIETDGFFVISFRGLGDNRDGAILVFEGDVTADAPCEAVVATADSWIGFLPAGEYNVAVTSNGGDEGACGEFGVTIVQNEYEFTGVADTEVLPVSNSGFGCISDPNNIWAFLLTYTPEEDGAYNFAAVGRQDGQDTGVLAVSFVVPTNSLSANLTSFDANCYMTEAVISFDFEQIGYVLEAGTEYTIALYDFDTEGVIMAWANAEMVVEIVFDDCDNMDYEDQNDWLRPNVPALSVTTDCEEGTAEFFFDVRQTSFETDQFVVVDAVSCTNPDDTRNSIDGACVLYYGAQGSERDGDTPAVAPEPCYNFIISGDSGDGGAVFCWFPAEENLTIVPTTYGSGASGKYTLTVDSYDIVGCIPKNPFIEVSTDSLSSLPITVSQAPATSASSPASSEPSDSPDSSEPSDSSSLLAFAIAMILAFV